MGLALRRAAALLLLASLAGCSTISGWFSMDDDEDPRQPAPLTDIDAQVRVKRLWSVGVGDGQGKGLYSLQPVISGDRIYAAAADGEVRAVELESGRGVWKIDAGHGLSGGVGLYGDALLLGGADGEVILLDAGSGEERWIAYLSGEVLAPPQADGEVVVAQTYDGKLYGLDYRSGEKLWNFDSNVPVLTIRGTSTPILVDGVAFAGFANGRVLAFDAQTGAVLWEARIAIPQGRSEIERIVDVDGTMVLQGSELYVASYQGRVAALDARTGRKIWQQNVSLFSGVSQGFGNVYVAEENGSVTAFLRNGQGIRWQQEALAWRGLSRPVPVSSYVAVADFEGYVHLLSQVDGAIVGRLRPDSDGVRADMLSIGSQLYLFTNSGKLQAYSVTPKD
jgi:outer membrane protein assembly factor BamB